MNAKEFEKYLNNQSDKFAVFTDKNLTSQLQMPIENLTDIISKNLSDEEKNKFIHAFPKFGTYLIPILKSIQDDKMKMDILEEDLFKDNKVVSHLKYVDLIKSFSDNGKLEFLIKHQEFCEQHNIRKYHFSNIITSSKELTKRILDDSNLKSQIFGDDEKISDLDILKQFENIDILCDFVRENSNYLKEKNISVYNLISLKSANDQLKFVSQLHNLGISESEQLMVLATLNEETKNLIDKSTLSEHEQEVLDIKTNKGLIDVDFSEDMSKYRGLDKLIEIYPQKLSSEQMTKVKELVEICPDLNVKNIFKLSFKNIFNTYNSTVQEFLNSEKWIDSVITQIDSKWSDVQKLAFIDNSIGKKVSYSPDFETEVENKDEQRALWKIIDSGYGTCVGISQIEQYMLRKVGIDSTQIGTGTHSYLKINNIEIPKSDGTSIIGNTLIDPTWNLDSNRFDAYPNYFCKSYEQIRKSDILLDGTDMLCHRNDEELKNIDTIEMEEDVVREVYKSIGLANEDKTFRFSQMMKKSNEIAKSNITLEEKLKQELDLLKEFHPDFANYLNSSISIIADNLLNHEEMKFDKIVANRVFKRDDNSKKAVMYIWANMGNSEAFYVADPNLGEFISMDRQEFVDKYECYQKDLDKSKGINPWDTLQINRKETKDNEYFH